MFFLQFSCFFNNATDIGNLISSSSAFSKSSLHIWKFSVHLLWKPSLKEFEHYFASMWNDCNCVVVWTFFGIDFLWDWNENWPFPVLWPLLSFPSFFPSTHHYLTQYVGAQSLSCIQLFVTSSTVACQTPSSLGFPRQEWSGLPLPSPGDLPDSGIEAISPTLKAVSLPLSYLGRPEILCVCVCVCVYV